MNSNEINSGAKASSLSSADVVENSAEAAVANPAITNSAVGAALAQASASAAAFLGGGPSSSPKTAAPIATPLIPKVKIQELSEKIEEAPAPKVAAAAATPASTSEASKVVSNKMPAIVELPQIGNYLDFRKFLSDYYQYRREISKKDIRPYNYAVFSAAANIKSPNYLKLIIEGRRNLSDEMITKFAKALGLTKDQTEEFRLMVLFGQATDPAERNMHLKALNEKRVDSKLKSGEIDQKTWEKIPSWITWIMYSLLDQENVKFEPEKLRETLRNKATADEISAAMNSLLKTGEIVKDEATGEMKKARSLMESAEDVPVALVRKLQAELMYLGLESLFHDGPTEREFGSATLSMTKAEFEDLRFQLRKLRKEAQKNIGVKRLSSKGERVYQLNLQLFPVSNKTE